MSQHVQYGYYDPYSPGGRTVQGSPQLAQQPGMGGVPVDPGARGQGDQVQRAQHQHPAQQAQQVQPPYQSQGPTSPGPPEPTPRPPGPSRMDTAETSGPAASGGVGPQGGPTAPPSAMGGPQPAPVGGGGSPAPVAQPLVDILETPDEVVILADVPGFEEEEITIQADESSLSLVAHRSNDADEEYRVVHSERPTRLERVVQLPPNGDIDGASATHDNGVCTVTIPKDGTDRREIGFH
ncbi:Hsp20/alpha crystallin family protein [Halorarum halophilum]|uniref:Hsp20/alpha crystallin family protein n=1 Tax=Halorarum halophilum TaxID=2743090 RepID=A0A7D5GI11_9EURY|nr:Hsp20/alpha crystallin family protein [Halobaculum halophilum]QLG27851.1 Hsp20/alpha crystallin family protein [Halobaculum halophilum]